MPESIKDRFTKSHEYIFLLSKNERYYFDHEAAKEPAVSTKPPGNKRAHKGVADDPRHHQTRVGLTAYADRARKRGVPPHHAQYPSSDQSNLDNVGRGELRTKRSVWDVAVSPYKGAHFATFPPDLIEPCILAGSRPGDLVLDPFMGSGTTAQVALQHGRRALGCEINPEYITLAHERIAKALPAEVDYFA